jgi:hypothetical protein
VGCKKQHCYKSGARSGNPRSAYLCLDVANLIYFLIPKNDEKIPIKKSQNFLGFLIF